MRRLVTLLFACSFVACTLVAPTSSLRANGADAGDAGADAPALDGALPDGSTPDGRVDGASRFCMGTTHTVCEDFDDGVFSPTWSTNACNGCAINVTQGASTSPPFALSTALPRRSAGATTGTYATLGLIFGGAWQRTRVEVDFQVKSTTWQASDVNAGILCIVFESDTVTEGPCVSVGQNYVDFSGPGGGMTAPALVWDQWHHLVLELDPTGSIAMTIDNQTLKDSFPALAQGANPKTRVDVGIHGYNQPSPDFSVLYDNVTIDRF